MVGISLPPRRLCGRLDQAQAGAFIGRRHSRSLHPGVDRKDARTVRFILLFSLLLLGGCANPLNRATSDRYSDMCSSAERGGDLTTAEQACYRALVNVDMGNLGPELKSQRLYNLGRIKRRVAKYEEAEDLFKQSLVIEEKLSPPTDPKIGRRL